METEGIVGKGQNEIEQKKKPKTIRQHLVNLGPALVLTEQIKNFL